MLETEADSLYEILIDLSVGPRGFTRVFNRYTHRTEDLKLGLINKIALAVTGETHIDNRGYPNWTGTLPFYAYKADVIGQKVILLDYRHGFNGRLDRYITPE